MQRLPYLRRTTACGKAPTFRRGRGGLPATRASATRKAEVNVKEMTRKLRAKLEAQLAELKAKEGVLEERAEVEALLVQLDAVEVQERETQAMINETRLMYAQMALAFLFSVASFVIVFRDKCFFTCFRL